MKGLIPKMLGSVGIQILGYSLHSSHLEELVLERALKAQSSLCMFPRISQLPFFKSFPQQNFCF